MTWRVVAGDALERMRELADGSVDAVVTDPPYDLTAVSRDGSPRQFVDNPYGRSRVGIDRGGFMGKSWDGTGVAFKPETWREALRVLKPGGHLLAFGGTRTFHRLACAVEDAGFEVRDCLMWLYGAGFPKSLNVGRAMDDGRGHRGDFRLREARAWEGHGTALKPGWEPIIVARKPLSGTVASNVLAHGTGGLNIDGCRIGTDENLNGGTYSEGGNKSGLPGDERDIKGAGMFAEGAGRIPGGFAQPSGRWPANVVLSHSEDCVRVGERQVRPVGATARDAGPTGSGASFVSGKPHAGYRDENGLETVERWACVPGCPVRALDDQQPVAGAGGQASGPTRVDGNEGWSGGWGGVAAPAPFYGDRGGPSRFFYTAKASRAERNAGLDGFEERESREWRTGNAPPNVDHRVPDRRAANSHPTVKPIDLMRWLVRLVTPPGGTVLDPFLGSGTTGIAAVLEGFEFVGIEREPEYVQIAEARIRWWAEHPTGLPVEQALAAEGRRRKTRESGQLGLLG